MSRDRARRLTKIADLRRKQLDLRVAELADARAIEVRAQQRVDEVRREIVQALAERDALAARGANAEEWVECDRWIDSRHKAEAHAQVALTSAREEVEAARGRVREAQSHVDRIETLVAKLADEARRAEGRAERKLEDELATRASASRMRANQS